MPAPVRVRARIRHRHHAGEAGRLNFSRKHFGDRRSPALRERVRLQKLLPHRAEINEMFRLAEIFLRRLNFGDDRSLFHRAEQRMKRLARLEINRPVLHLDRDVRTELPIQPHELDVSALGAIRIDVVVVNKRAPDDVALVRRERIGQHIGAIGMSAAVSFRAGLPFGICLHEKTAEVRNQPVNLVRLGLPPIDHALVQRIGRGQSAQPRGRGKIRGQIHPHAIRPPHIRQRGNFAQHLRPKNAHVGIDVVDDRAVDADGGAGARVIRVTRAEFFRQFVPLPQRRARRNRVQSCRSNCPSDSSTEAATRAARRC